MSRLEEALEKAAMMRGTQNAIIPPKSPSATPVHIPPPATAEAINVTNQLLVAATDPHTPVAEEYRKLKTLLVQHTKGESRNMLLVSSSISSEGKSITALNLALTLAQESDHTVLLVDADLRKPSIHRYLGLEKRAGLTECLLGEVDFKDAVIHTGIGKLALLQAGKEARRNPGEIFSSQKTREFFAEVKRRYPDRYVIIDSPPVLPFAETRSLSTMVDGVILVAKEGMVPLRQLKETLDCLKGTHILGIVYNEATEETQSVYHQYYRECLAEAV